MLWHYYQSKFHANNLISCSIKCRHAAAVGFGVCVCLRKKQNYRRIRFTTLHNALRCDITRYILILRDFRAPLSSLLPSKGRAFGKHLNIVSLIIKLKSLQPPSFTSFVPPLRICFGFFVYTREWEFESISEHKKSSTGTKSYLSKIILYSLPTQSH